jgi:hypothetical protein
MNRGWHTFDIQHSTWNSQQSHKSHRSLGLRHSPRSGGQQCSHLGAHAPPAVSQRYTPSAHVRIRHAARATPPVTSPHLRNDNNNHPVPVGTPPVSHWDTDRVPLGHRPCTTGTRTKYHWDTDRVPLGHRPCTTGTPTVYHWDTHRVPLGHPPCTTGTPTVYHWDTPHVPLGHPPCTTGTPPHVPLGHRPCPTAANADTSVRTCAPPVAVQGAHVRAHVAGSVTLRRVPALPLTVATALHLSLHKCTEDGAHSTFDTQH